MDYYLVQYCTVITESLRGILKNCFESNFQYKKNMHEKSAMYQFIKQSTLANQNNLNRM